MKNNHPFYCFLSIIFRVPKIGKRDQKMTTINIERFHQLTKDHKNFLH